MVQDTRHCACDYVLNLSSQAAVPSPRQQHLGLSHLHVLKQPMTDMSKYKVSQESYRIDRHPMTRHCLSATTVHPSRSLSLSRCLSPSDSHMLPWLPVCRSSFLEDNAVTHELHITGSKLGDCGIPATHHSGCLGRICQGCSPAHTPKTCLHLRSLLHHRTCADHLPAPPRHLCRAVVTVLQFQGESLGRGVSTKLDQVPWVQVGAGTWRQQTAIDPGAPSSAQVLQAVPAGGAKTQKPMSTPARVVHAGPWLPGKPHGRARARTHLRIMVCLCLRRNIASGV